MFAVSMTPHVNTRVKRSPTRMALRSAFHQQRIGSDSTSPGRGARVVCAATGGTPSTLATRRTRQIRWVMALLDPQADFRPSASRRTLHFAKPPFGGEFYERGFHLPAVEADADDVEPRRARLRLDAILPRADPVGQPAQLAPRQHARSAALDVVRFDPAVRHGGQLIRKADVGNQQ